MGRLSNATTTEVLETKLYPHVSVHRLPSEEKIVAAVRDVHTRVTGARGPTARAALRSAIARLLARRVRTIVRQRDDEQAVTDVGRQLIGLARRIVPHPLTAAQHGLRVCLLGLLSEHVQNHAASAAM